MLESAVNLSRLQFALTAMYHFLFVPLTLGLVFVMAIMETVYVKTGKEIWRDMVKFWSKLFGINFAMGVATGITLEFQFGTNWAYYSHYVGDIFGVPLAIEGMMAFFLESTFVGLFFFGWDKLSKKAHCIVTWLVAIGSSLSALWIMVANGFMQNPVGAQFNPDTMRMELTSIGDVFFNPVAQTVFSHTTLAGYVTGSMFVMAISAWYLLRGRNVEFAKRSLFVASVFGLITLLGTIYLGDENGRNVYRYQREKLAAMEAMWETHPAPAPLVVMAIPSNKEKKNYLEVKIPWLVGLLNTHSFDTVIPGIDQLVEENKFKIIKALNVYMALETYRENPEENRVLRDYLTENGNILGYALLLKKYTDDPLKATDEMIEKAAWDTIPNVFALFFAFRIMMGAGVAMLGIIALSLFFQLRGKIPPKLVLWGVFMSLPLPWIANEFGWLVTEYGRQPWTIRGVLPTAVSASTVSAENVIFTLVSFILLYTTLAVVDLVLLIKYAKMGPEKAIGNDDKIAVEAQ